MPHIQSKSVFSGQIQQYILLLLTEPAVGQDLVRCVICCWKNSVFNNAIPGLFFSFFVFPKQEQQIKLANDLNRTVNLGIWERPLFQLDHNLCPEKIKFSLDKMEAN